MVCSLIGRELPTIVVGKTKSGIKIKAAGLSAKSIRPLREMIVGKQEARAVEKDDRMAWKERMNQRRVTCNGCFKPERSDGVKFMQCSSCKSKMDRHVPYCSQYVFIRSHRSAPVLQRSFGLLASARSRIGRTTNRYVENQ